MIEPIKKTPPANRNEAATDNYVKAYNLDVKIKTAALSAQQSLYDMCIGFKEMRDEKLYKELGYKNFEEYCEEEVGITRQQCYKYISIVENLPSDFVNPGLHFGVKKLYLLSTLSEEQRTEIADNTDLESVTVRELEQKIKEIRAQKDKAVAEKSSIETQLQSKDDTILALGKTKVELQNRINELQNEIDELESRPIEVNSIPENCIAKSAYESMVDDYVGQLRDKDEEFVAEKRRAHAEKTELENQLEDVKAQLDAARSGNNKPDPRDEAMNYIAVALDCLKHARNALSENYDTLFHGVVELEEAVKDFFDNKLEAV